MDFSERKKIAKLVFFIFIFSFVFGSSLATQNVAKNCYYDRILGNGLTVGNFKIYMPYKFYIWDEKQFHTLLLTLKNGYIFQCLQVLF